MTGWLERIALKNAVTPGGRMYRKCIPISYITSLGPTCRGMNILRHRALSDPASASDVLLFRHRIKVPPGQF